MVCSSIDSTSRHRPFNSQTHTQQGALPSAVRRRPCSIRCLRRQPWPRTRSFLRPPLAPCPSYYGGGGGGLLPHVPAAPVRPGLAVRLITAANLDAELDLIASLLPRFPYVAIDTEYPGTVHRPPAGKREADLRPAERYALVKCNVDEVPVVQLGITLCDKLGDLPTSATPDPTGGGGPGPLLHLAWEVTFSDFDPLLHRHAPESVAFLRQRGVRFGTGVSSAAFAARLAAVLASSSRWGDLTWAAFGGAYDFGYMVRMLSGGRPLPETWHEFVAEARALLGGRVFDARYMAEHCGRGDLPCGLRRVAAKLGVPESFMAPPCLAWQKSYAACRIFKAMRRNVMYRDGGAGLHCMIDGLH